MESAMKHPANLPEDMVELDKLAAPLVEWIRETYGYNTEIRISADRVDVMQDIMGIPYPLSEP